MVDRLASIALGTRDWSSVVSEKGNSSARKLMEHTDLLQGRHVQLCPLAPEHYRDLYEITLQPSMASRWEPSAQGGSFEGWTRRLWDGVLCQFGVHTKGSRRAIHGLVRCYGANFRHSTAQVSLFVGEHAHRTGIGLEATALFIDFLFRKHPFRKLYAETMEFNLPQFAAGIGKFFEVEGVLRAHEIHDGQAWNNYILSIRREFWSDVGAKSAARLRRSAPA